MNPFEPQIPSVFSIETPFQALCAIAAIRQLDITDYKLIVYFPRNEVRNVQLRTILKKYGVKYKAVKPFNRFTYRYAKWSALRKHHTRFRRLFIGDFRDITLYYLSLSYVDDGSDIVYLDDGSVTVSFLNNIVDGPLDEYGKVFLDKLKTKRGIVANRNVLTIYDHIENPKFQIKILNLSLIMSHNQTEEAKGVFIVGTNISSYCDPLGIPVDIYIRKLDELFSELQTSHPNDKLTFVPHGRDKSEYAKKICEKYGVSFEPSLMTIELKMLDMQNPPKVVYGFTSSALFNLRKLFPHARIVNVLYEGNSRNPFWSEYRMLSEYYVKNGIELVIKSL